MLASESIIGRRVRELRDMRAIGQEDLAARAGLRAQTVSKIELGKIKNPTAKTLMALAGALGVAVSELTTDHNHGQPWQSAIEAATKRFESRIEELEGRLVAFVRQSEQHTPGRAAPHQRRARRTKQ